MNEGLNKAAVVARLTQFGYNELPASKPKSLVKIALDVVKEPMFILLISCASLYMIIGDYREGIILLSAVSIIIFITFYQSQKTEKALDALRNMASPRAVVMREGEQIRIPGRELVPDDILLLNEGDRVAADCVIISSVNLSIDESLLTGESMPVTKSIDQHAFSGSLVVQGKAMALVIHTGVRTEFGKLGNTLSKIKDEETELQREMKVLVRNFFIAGAIISLAVVIAFYFSTGVFIQSLLNGLAAAMAILPEEFPVVLTVFFALGSWRLSNKNVLTRKSSAIESLGLCERFVQRQNRHISKAVNEAIQKDAEEKDRSKNYIINKVLTNHYFPEPKKKKKSD